MLQSKLTLIFNDPFSVFFIVAVSVVIARLNAEDTIPVANKAFAYMSLAAGPPGKISRKMPFNCLVP